ncbi:MAG: hypothetical protein B5M51_02145, partial [Anaerolinea sp. 4484_236]
MEPTVLDNIPFEPTPEAIQVVIDTRLGKKSTEPFQALVKEAQKIARPKAMYKVAYVSEKGENYVKIGRQTFTSHLLRQNLEDVHRVFLYVATCGQELEDWMMSKPDMLEQYYASTVNELALDAARERLIDHIESRHELSKMASMAPGSLEDWPIQEQRPLFAILGDTEKAIGVRLFDSLLMHPSKTVSGIRYPSESTFASC